MECLRPGLLPRKLLLPQAAVPDDDDDDEVIDVAPDGSRLPSRAPMSGGFAKAAQCV